MFECPLPRVWVGARGVWVRPGNKDQDSQRHHVGGAFPAEEQRLQDVQDETEESGEVHLREQPRRLQQWVDGESIVHGENKTQSLFCYFKGKFSILNILCFEIQPEIPQRNLETSLNSMKNVAMFEETYLFLSPNNP